MASSNDNSPKLDLESYISNYKGRLRIDRLLAIGRSNSHLAPDALRLAINEVKRSSNAEEYAKLANQLQEIAPTDPLAAIDTNWVSATTRRSMMETERLEAELKQYKNNLIKESIRMGNEDLGNHYFIMGEYNNAQKCYTRMRESCTTSKHIVEMNLKLLNVAIAHKNWSHAVTFGVKITSLGIKAEDRVAKFDPLINATTGLAHLNLGHYKDAAELFLAVNPTYMALEPLASIEFQKEVISPNDIAIYGGLCALATYDSAELKKHVLENQPFRQFLELESHLRRAISMFCGSKFSACLAVLDSYAADYKLDLYLQSHFAKLYQRIRTKSLVQWLSAFSCVTFQEIQKAFPAPDQTSLGSKKQPYSLLAELEDLIKSGSLNARIDMADELLISPSPDPRLVVIERTLDMAKAQEKTLRLKLHRISMMSAGLEVKTAKHQTSSTFGQAMSSDGGSFADRGRRKDQQGPTSSFMV